MLTSPSNLELWQRLQDFSLDDPQASFPFSQRLAREQGWTAAYAARVIEEYKRYLYLCVTEAAPVCPSEAVDEAWHLHLTYTRSYWGVLCPQVLGQPLHHDPTSGGPDQREYHVAMYRRTLAAYRAAFGTEPPADIWPAVEERFDPRTRRQTVDLSRWWVLPRPRWLRLQNPLRSRQVQHWMWGLPLLLGVINPFDLRGPEFLMFFAMTTVATFVAWLVLSVWLRWTSTAVAPEGLNAEEVGYLNTGEAGALAAVLAESFKDESLQLAEHVQEGQDALLQLGPATSSGSSRIAQCLRGHVSQGKTRLRELQLALREDWDELRESLIERGLLLSPGQIATFKGVTALLVLGLMILAGIKLYLGVVRERPIGILIMIEAILFFVGINAFVLLSPRRSLAGDSVLRELKAKHPRLTSPPADDSLSPASLALVAGLYGIAVPGLLPPVLLTDYRRQFPGTEGGGGGSGCGGGTGCGGGGCGGGGCGGGCGGCS